MRIQQVKYKVSVMPNNSEHHLYNVITNVLKRFKSQANLIKKRNTPFFSFLCSIFPHI